MLRLIAQRTTARTHAAGTALAPHATIACQPLRRTMASSAAESTTASAGGPMQQLIHQKLTTALSPVHLSIANESYMHAGPRDAESHFKVTVVSPAFESLALLARHRKVNAVLADELKNGIHALSITARTPEQWATDQTVAKSPSCLGGSKHDPTKR